MFILITGKPGSGKSFYAVDYLSKNKDKYFSVECNINGLKFHDNVVALNFNRLFNIVSQCKEIYDNQIAMLGDGSASNVIDEPIIEYLLEIGFIELNSDYVFYLDKKKKRESYSSFVQYLLNTFSPIYSEPKYKPSLFIIDECQNHFPSIDRTTGKSAPADPVLLWWESYHRHLCMDVILLAQHYDKVHSSYLKDIEYFLDAIPSSRILGTKFKYKHYIKIPYYKTNEVATIKLKKDKKIFDLYQSGDRVRTKNVILPWLIGSFAGLILVVGIFYFVRKELFTPDSVEKKHVSKTVSSVKHNNVRSSSNHVSLHKNKQFVDMTDLHYISLICIKNMCSNVKEGVRVNIRDLKSLLEGTHSKLIRQDIVKSSLGLSKVYLLVSSSFLELFQSRSVNYENKDFSLIP